MSVKAIFQQLTSDLGTTLLLDRDSPKQVSKVLAKFLVDLPDTIRQPMLFDQQGFHFVEYDECCL
jgi:hypothetical protein